MAAPNHSLQISAQVELGKIGMLPAFTDYNQIGRGVKAGDRVGQLAVDSLTHHARESGGGEMPFRIGENRAGMRLRDPCTGFIQRDELRREFRLHIHADRATQVGQRRGISPWFETMQNVYSGRHALGRPRRMIINAARVNRAVSTGENRRHSKQDGG